MVAREDPSLFPSVVPLYNYLLHMPIYGSYSAFICVAGEHVEHFNETADGSTITSFVESVQGQVCETACCLVR